MEIEAKFALTAPVSADHVEALTWEPYHLAERHTVDQQDTFFDTPDLALAHTRYAVRLRIGGATPVVTLKGPGKVENGVHTRGEWEEPATDHDPEGWPEAIRQRLQELIGMQAIQPLFRVHNRRRTWMLLQDERIVGEVALDEGSIVAGPEHAPMHELEVELKGGSETELATICRLIQRQLPAQPEDRSKFDRGLTLLQKLRSTPTSTD